MTFDQQRDVENEGQRAAFNAHPADRTEAEKAAILSAADLINEVLYDERNDIWGRHMLRLLDAETKLRAMVEAV